MMRKERGKNVETEAWEALGSRCRRHPSQGGMGICPFCLKERLSKLVCPDCGEQRPSSCSCSEASSSSSSAINGGSVDVGSVGRISFLIERDRPDHLDPSKPDAIVLFRRAKSAAWRPDTPVLYESKSCPPEASSKKKSLWSFLHFAKRKTPGGVGGGESREPARGSSASASDRLVKSRSVGLGRKSFSGYGFLWEKSADTHGLCTPTRSKDLTPTNDGNPPNDSRPRTSTGRSRGWSWAFSSPMRVFKHSANRKVPKEANGPSPFPLVEMCRG